MSGGSQRILLTSLTFICGIIDIVMFGVLLPLCLVVGTVALCKASYSARKELAHIVYSDPLVVLIFQNNSISL